MFDPKDIGTRFDPPATADQVATGTPVDGSDPPTLFSLLKGILLQLIVLNEDGK